MLLGPFHTQIHCDITFKQTIILWLHCNISRQLRQRWSAVMVFTLYFILFHTYLVRYVWWFLHRSFCIEYMLCGEISSPLARSRMRLKMCHFAREIGTWIQFLITKAYSDFIQGKNKVTLSVVPKGKTEFGFCSINQWALMRNKFRVLIENRLFF